MFKRIFGDMIFEYLCMFVMLIQLTVFDNEFHVCLIPTECLSYNLQLSGGSLSWTKSANLPSPGPLCKLLVVASKPLGYWGVGSDLSIT